MLVPDIAFHQFHLFPRRSNVVTVKPDLMTSWRLAEYPPETQGINVVSSRWSTQVSSLRTSHEFREHLTAFSFPGSPLNTQQILVSKTLLTSGVHVKRQLLGALVPQGPLWATRSVQLSSRGHSLRGRLPYYSV